MLALLLALFTVSGTAPCRLADSLDCLPSDYGIASASLRCALVGWRVGTDPETLARINAPPCMPFTVTADDRGLAWQLAVVFANDAGWSCKSNSVGRNWPPVGVPVTHVVADSALFDLLGRRVHGPVTHGVYFARAGKRYRVVVR